MSQNSKITALSKILALFSVGVGIRILINHGFDYIVYPLVLVWLGNIKGGILLTILALIANVLIIRAYDWSKTDWLLIEKIKKEIHENSHTGWKKRVYEFLKQNKVFAFLLLCLDDPVTVTLYFREGSYQFNGLNGKDWKIFILANLVSNLYWIIGWVAIIEFVKKLLTFNIF